MGVCGAGGHWTHGPFLLTSDFCGASHYGQSEKGQSLEPIARETDGRNEINMSRNLTNCYQVVRCNLKVPMGANLRPPKCLAGFQQNNQFK